MIQCDLIVVSKYSSLPGFGISSKVYQTASYLSDYYQVVLITSNSNHLANFPSSKSLFNHAKIGSLKTIWINTLKYNSSKSVRRILTWFDFEMKLNKLKIDSKHPPKVVLVSSLSLFTILWGLKLKRKYGTKVIFEVRDIYPLTLTHEVGVSRINPVVLLMGWIEKIGYLKSDLIVGTMPKLSIHVRNILNYDKEVFYSPIGLSSYYEPSIGNNHRLTIPQKYSESLIVGYSGSIGESNYLDPLIRVIKRLKNNINYYFIIVGSGDYLNRYKSDLEDCSNVHFTERVDPTHVQDYLSQVDCLYLSVKPSIIWEHGQSMNKVLDYLMAGKPIIAAYDGYPNMLSEIDGNLIIPSNDDVALVQALEKVARYDEILMESISINAPKLVMNNYLYDLINEKYYQRIKKLIDNNNTHTT